MLNTEYWLYAFRYGTINILFEHSAMHLKCVGISKAQGSSYE